MELRKIKINDVVVKPPPNDKPIDPKLIKGYDMFKEIYCNVFIVAKKKSGKSVVILNILKNCIDKNTKIIIFCSSLNKDNCYKHMIQYFTKKGNTILTYHAIKEGGVDQLHEIIDTIEQDCDKQKDDIESEDEDIKKICLFGDEYKKKRKKKKPKKPKMISPEYVFIFDDLSKQLRLNSVTRLLKANRHIFAKILISSQYLHDLQPEAIQQLDNAILFANIIRKKLEIIYEGLDLHIEFETFLQLYINATKDKYSFLYIDRNNCEFRENFNKLYTIK